MKTYTVELTPYPVQLLNIKANSKEEAIQKASKSVDFSVWEADAQEDD